jgi:hypothetical protein
VSDANPFAFDVPGAPPTRPTPRRRTPGPAGRRTAVFAPVACLLVGGAVGGYLLLRPHTRPPEDAYQDIMRSAEAGDWGRVWDRVDRRSQEHLEVGMAFMGALATADDPEKAAKLKVLSRRERFVYLMSLDGEHRRWWLQPRAVRQVRREGDRATLTVVTTGPGEARTETVYMLREDGVWKLSFGY